MGLTEGHMAKTVWENPAEIVRSLRPENPVLVFAPTVLQDRARQFLASFPGLVTYAVKSNPDEAVITNLVAAGIRGFDVASLAEIELVATAVHEMTATAQDVARNATHAAEAANHADQAANQGKQVVQETSAAIAALAFAAVTAGAAGLPALALVAATTVAGLLHRAGG